MAPFLYYSLLSLAFILTFKLLLQKRRFKNLPPSPPSLPIIGNLYHLKPPLHRSLHALSQKYGHIFSLRFGSRLAVAISSPALAQECFTKYDTVLANRPRALTGKHLFYNYTSLDSAPYGDHWRNLRRIITIDVLSTQRLNSFIETRRDESRRFIRKLAQDTCEGFTRVELRSRLTEMIFNNMMRMISGKEVEETEEFREVMAEMLPLFDASNKADFLPMLQWFDFDGLVKRMKKISKRADAFLQGIVEEHRSGKDSANTMIHHLLTMQESQPEYYSDHIIKGLIQGMFLGGTDTTAGTIEWAMSALLNHPKILKREYLLGMFLGGTDTTAGTIEWAMSALLNHPKILKRAKDELDTHVGQDRLVDESDISNLPYLQNIIHETLRLYSPAPLLLPHFSSDECNIGGFTIPRDTIVFINAWAIHRDPEIWTDALCFKPERFEKEGETKKVISFGLGRRACPGLSLAHRTIGMILGLLIQCFEWKQLTDAEIDMRENKGVVMTKLIPLEAMCKALPMTKKVM